MNPVVKFVSLSAKRYKGVATCFWSVGFLYSGVGYAILSIRFLVLRADLPFWRMRTLDAEDVEDLARRCGLRVRS